MEYFAIFFSIFLLILGSYSFMTSKERDNAFKKSLKWPSAKGQILFSGTCFLYDLPDKKNSELTFPQIFYRYSVNGISYRSNILQMEGASNYTQSQDIDYYKVKYPKDASVQVFYNPQCPGEAYIEPSQNSHWIDQLLGMSIFIIGFLMACRYYG